MSLRKKLSRLRSAGPGSAPPREDAADPANGEAKEQEFAAPADDAGLDRRSRRIASLQRQLDRVVVDGRRELRGKRPQESDVLARLLRDAPALRKEEPHGVLPGETEQTEHGPVHFIRQWLEPSHCHGRAPVAAALGCAPDLISRLALDPTLAAIDPTRMLLIDTETTGLSTGAGTIPFLVGVGFFEDQSLCVEQMMLIRRHEEPAMLRHLARRIAEASCVVSYNGKSFDWPLLRSRFVMNRVETPPLPPHIDLLHCARRAFKRRLKSMRLVEMEKEILGMVREHDVAGAEIPGIYLTFLRSGNPGRLDGVVEHNGHDLVALASFLGEIVRRYETVQRKDDPRDHLSYALIAEKSGDKERAVLFSEAAATGGGEDVTRVTALMLAARMARRRKDVVAEGKALTEAVQIAEHDARIHLELAKHFEHRVKDLARASVHAARTVPAETIEQKEKRMRRLRRRKESSAKSRK